MRYDDTLDAYRVPVSRDERPSTTLVLAVADIVGSDVTGLPPLRSVVDPDALDALFATNPPVHVEFEYYGCLVSIREGTEILVYPPRGERDPDGDPDR